VVKRTYKHIHNAYGDVGVIFGAKTKTLQYIGVGNKQCVMSKQAKNKTVEAKKNREKQNS
jgi:hypothetical protein